ncbi:MAG: branched-chain amino acid aminotransferase [Bacteroidetes bacterium]|nr:branched-chain amino acid aminotransferase [Bacteroidota bacterium]
MANIDTLPINITRANKSNLSQVDLSNIPFGRVFTDHMLVADYKDGEWVSASIKPFGRLDMHPAMSALHYGQSIFEGLKAYKNQKGEPVLFRPYDNFERFNKSAERMCMATVPESIWMDGLMKLIEIDQAWIPTSQGSSLYIRPFMFATDEYVGIKPADNFRFVIFCSPVGAYYPEPISVKIEETFVRAAQGGIGAAKAAGNYGASLYPNKLAVEEGYRQLIWTDAKEHKYIEESGTMNVFFVINNEIITPSVERDTILKGITRKSVIQLSKDIGYLISERAVTVQEVVDAARNGNLQDAFGAGTAATIAHISAIGFRNERFELAPVSERTISNNILNKLDSIRLGKEADPYGWVVKV